MASEKRERQRANRDVKRAIESKSNRRQTVFKRARTFAIWAVVIAAVLFLANVVFGGDSDSALGPLIAL